MKIKVLTAALTLTAVMLLNGCSENNQDVSVIAEGNVISIKEAGLSAEIPEGWSLKAGDDIYKSIYSSYGGGYDSAEEMKEAMNAEGLSYVAYAAAKEENAMFTISCQDMMTTMKITEEGTERIAAGEYSRSVHDSMVFSYQASGYKIEEGSFSEIQIGDKTAYLSHFEILDGTDFIMGQSETLIEVGDFIYSFQICYADKNIKEEALSIKIAEEK